jgi:hypothetical protein
MYRKAFVVLALFAALPGQAPPAFASGPSALISANATGDRYQSQVTFTYAAPVSVTDPSTQVSFYRVGSVTPLAVTVTGSGTTTVVVTQNGTIASGASFTASVLPDGDITSDTVTWKTRAAPAHPTLHVKIITALAPDAVYDIVHRLDRANLLAVPKASDLVDISSAAAVPHALTNADLAGYQAALVVTDQDVFNQLAAASALTSFAAHGHGVVLGGQTHWTSGGLWTSLSAIGSAGGKWATDWSPLAYVDPPALEGGTLKASSVQPHFLTQHLTSFHVHGMGSGSEYIQTGLRFNSAVLASLQPTAAYDYGGLGQSLLAVHWETRDFPGRVVDLGFNPWSTDVASGGGGYDPAESPQAAPLIARALWWATDRIPPTRTHFTSKPHSPSMFATVFFSMAARDGDPASAFTGLRFQYRVGNGRWKMAKGGSSFALYHLRPGHRYRVRARAVDFAGNKDAKPASYTFRLSSSAYG